MTARPHVTVVGDVGLDVVAKLAGSVVFGHDTRARVALLRAARVATPQPG